MPIYATAGDSTTFTPAPEGVHQAVCVDVVDQGMHESVWEGVARKLHKVAISWQIGEMRDDGKPYLVSKWYTLSLHEKASLRKELESWRGRPFTEAELKKFDVESVVGVNALLNIQHGESKGKTYANVVSIMPLVKGMAKMVPSSDYVRVVDRPKDEQPPNVQPPAAGASADIVDDDIPFAWLLPLVLPALAMLGGVVA